MWNGTTIIKSPVVKSEMCAANTLKVMTSAKLALASKLGVSPSTLNRILTNKSGVSPEMALRLSKCLGRSPESWLAMQQSYDLWQTRQGLDLSNVEKLKIDTA